jgi:HAD superfamily hydrolase (TIGR01456 family)
MFGHQILLGRHEFIFFIIRISDHSQKREPLAASTVILSGPKMTFPNLTSSTELCTSSPKTTTHLSTQDLVPSKMAGRHYFSLKRAFKKSASFKAAFEHAIQSKNKHAMHILLEAQTSVPPGPCDFAFSFDIDGVLHNSPNPLPHASETLKFLKEKNIPFIFLTNSGGKSESTRVKMLEEEFDVDLDVSQFVQSHTPVLDYVPQHQNSCVLVIGGVGDSCRKVAEGYGFKNVITSADIITAYPKYWPFDEIARQYYGSFARPLPAPIDPTNPNSLRVSAIFVFSSSRDWGLDCQLIEDLLVSQGGVLGTQSCKNGDASLDDNGWQQDNQPTLVFCNPDVLWSTAWKHSPRFSQGAMIAALQGIWNFRTRGKAALQFTQLGKPCQGSFLYGEKVLNNYREKLFGKDAPKLRNVYHIGDSPVSDIRGANEYNSPFGSNWLSLLVETGIHRKGTIPEYQPTATLTHVKDAVNFALREEGWEEMP